jgi:hypothetical protein
MHEQSTEHQTKQDYIAAGEEIPEYVANPIAAFEPAAKWTNDMMTTLKGALKQKDLPLERLERLLELIERERLKHAEIEFNAAMARVQSAMTQVVRKGWNEQTKSTYAKLEDINNMLVPIYTSEGFAVSFSTDVSPIQGYVRTVCTLSNFGFSRTYPLDLPPDNAGLKGNDNKTMVHAIVSSGSYARRVLLTMAFNVAVKGADQDGNGMGPEAERADIEYITEEQHSRLVDQLTEKGLAEKWLCSKMRIKSLELCDLEAARYPLAEKIIADQKPVGGR